jgi:hypothetical protein
MKRNAELLLILILLLLAGSAWGQSGNGSVRGTVQDATAALIPGATVVLANTATGVEQRTTSNAAGIYVFPAIAPGPYRLKVSFSGMAEYNATLTVQVQQSSNIDIVLHPASATTTIQVTDVTPILVADNATLGNVLETKRIESLPINGRQLTQLLWAVPGVTFDNTMGYHATQRIRTFGEAAGTHDISLDGAPLTDMVNGEVSLQRQPSLESVQEFRVETNAASAKSARPTTVIMTTKGGTNEFHGSAFETNRDNFYGKARSRQDGNSPSKLVRNEFGFTAGGPVFIPKVYNGKNKTFWFFALEDFRLRSGPMGSWAVPTDAMRQGDFSGLTIGSKAVKIYNPYTTDPTTFQRDQFSYGGNLNVIDPSLMSPVYKYLMSVLPKANRPGVNPTAGANLFLPAQDNTDQSTWSTRIDQRVGDNDQVYVRLSASTSQRQYVVGGPPSTDGGAGWRGFYAPNKTAAADWTHTFSPTFFNEVMTSTTREINSAGPGSGQNSDLWANQLGLPNPANQTGFPVIGPFVNSSTFWSPPSPKGEFFSYYVVDDNATKIMGKHEIQFGFHGRRDLLNYLPQQNRAGGALTFPALATGLYSSAYPDRRSFTSNTGFTGASAFLGLADYEYRVTKSKYYMRRNEAAGYLQDNIRVSSRLNLNLGVRWDFNPSTTEKNNVFTTYDQQNKAIVLGRSLTDLYALNATSPLFISATQGVGVKYESLAEAGVSSPYYNNNWHDLSPHVGLAYRALDGAKSFVIRAGYSTNYFPVRMYGWNDVFKMNTPFYSQYLNNYNTAATASPDGVRNYGLVNRPSYIAGQNSTDAISFSNLNAGSLGLGNTFQAAYWDPDQPTSRLHTWNFTLEKEVMQNSRVRLSYNGSHGGHLESYENLNESLTNYGDYNWFSRYGTAVPGGSNAAMLTNTDPTSPMGAIDLYRKDGWSNANGLTVEFERRYAKGFGFQVFYQLVNALRAAGEGWDVSTDVPTAYPIGQVPDDREQRMRLLLYGRDLSIPKHEVRYNWTADLPFGRGKAVGRNMSKFLDGVIGGWQITGMGRLRSNYLQLPNVQQTYSNLLPTGAPVESYGHSIPIQDCRSGVCQAGYLLWNGYIPAYQINSTDPATGQPNGIMGVPANYKAAAAPLWPYPANYLTMDPASDPNYDRYGNSEVRVHLNDGTDVWTAKTDLAPWRNTLIPSTWLSNTDASLFKVFKFSESMNLKIQCDFFNVFNQPGTSFTPLDETGVVTKQFSQNAPRMLQLTARFRW